jgi:hypothetical protein
MPTLSKIVMAVRSTTAELRKTVTRLETELGKRAKADLAGLADQAKEEITTELLRLVSKLNE